VKTTERLHDLGQSLWLDNITCRVPTNGALRRYIREYSVTGLTSNLTIFPDTSLRACSWREEFDSLILIE
jgi:transaldolase